MSRSVAVHHRSSFGHRIGHGLEEVGEVELQDAKLPPWAQRTRRPGSFRDDGTIPKQRYLAPEFLDWELDRMWARVWQVAGREEEIAAAG